MIRRSSAPRGDASEIAPLATPGPPPAAEARPTGAPRLAYVDWMRGLAILIMIEAHVLDAWTRPADRSTPAFGCATILAGFAAPMFLFLAGVSAVLGSSARSRRTGDPAAAAASVRRRGWQILGLAYLFRLQAYMLNPKAMLAGVLKVDILNVMGPSIVVAAALWQAGRTFARRLGLFAAAALAVTLVTPLVRTAPVVDHLPPLAQWYLRPAPGRNNFTFFPWTGFVLAGGLVGVLLDRSRTARAERSFHALLASGALICAGACYAGSYLPSVYPDSRFWSSSPMFFLLRAGIVTSALSAIFFWERRPRVWPRSSWSPMATFGRASLFVYWVHVELVYGVFSRPFHARLSLAQAAAAFAAFSLAMFALVLAKDRSVASWREWRRVRRQVPELAS